MCGGGNNTQRLDSDPSFKGRIVCVCMSYNQAHQLQADVELFLVMEQKVVESFAVRHFK